MEDKGDELQQYLMAFGPSRHRAWVVGQSPQGCFLGSLRSALGGLWGVVLGPHGSLLGACWEAPVGLLGLPGGLLGVSWWLLGGLLGLPGSL